MKPQLSFKISDLVFSHINDFSDMGDGKHYLYNIGVLLIWVCVDMQGKVTCLMPTEDIDGWEFDEGKEPTEDELAIHQIEVILLEEFYLEEVQQLIDKHNGNY
jgi:hypothetical protein